MKKAICFGEVLWDIFPSGKKIGGAPFNVARQISKFGFDCNLISAVGKDKLGEDLLSKINDSKISLDTIQSKSDLATGTVQISLDENGSATYSISKPVAWDAIEVNTKIEQLVRASDVFIYGSLATRSKISRESLLELLNISKFNVFDLNLRAPHYQFDNLKYMMKQADFLKLNDEEVALICSHLDITQNGIKSQMLEISKKFSVDYVAVTLGDKGAMLLHDRQFFTSDSYKVDVKDTVGAGDAFLAALISNLLKFEQPLLALNYACAVGALVASKEGANPDISEIEIQKMLNS